MAPAGAVVKASSASSDAGVIAGLIAGYVDGRLHLKEVPLDTPPRSIYQARRVKGKLEIIEGTSTARPLRSVKFFTRRTLARHLSWTWKGGNSADDAQPSDRFYTAFKALTQLILSGAATPAELEKRYRAAERTCLEGRLGRHVLLPKEASRKRPKRFRVLAIL
jgi:hypothetical protein